MRKYKIEPKRIRFVHPNKNTVSNLVLIEGVRGGKPFLKFEKPLYEIEEKIMKINELLPGGFSM